MNNAYFKDVKTVGDLFLDHTFFEFEGMPMIFTCRDIDKNLYFCICTDPREVEKWIIARSNISILKGLVEKRLDLKGALCGFDAQKILITADDSGDSSVVMQFKDVNSHHLPDSGVFMRHVQSKDRAYVNSLESGISSLKAAIKGNSINNIDSQAA